MDQQLDAHPSTQTCRRLIRLDDVGRNDVALVGGKNASLGEMIAGLAGKGIRIPDGFATTTDAFRELLEVAGLQPRVTAALASFRSGATDLATTGAAIRALFLEAKLPPALESEIAQAYRDLGRRHDLVDPAVAVRSSATCEDLTDASFAGQQETFLNVRGERALLDACRGCFASLYTDRAISYREGKGLRDEDMALSIGVQLMVRSDLAGSGVIFTLDRKPAFRAPRRSAPCGGWARPSFRVWWIRTPTPSSNPWPATTGCARSSSGLADRSGKRWCSRPTPRSARRSSPPATTNARPSCSATMRSFN
jgi:pyruvate,water dikinase